jgi:hypothetical protein
MHIAEPVLVPAAGGELCPSCGAQVATDQRYCIECGERQGASRFSLPDTRASAAPPPASPRRRRLQPSSSAALIAGVGTLLVAMAVGVLIGRSGNQTNAAAPPVRVVTVPGAATGTAAAATATPDASTATKAADKSKQSQKSKSTSSTAKPAAVKTPPPTVQVGSPGHGKGYKNGKFTGDFFGP